MASKKKARDAKPASRSSFRKTQPKAKKPAKQVAKKKPANKKPANKKPANKKPANKKPANKRPANKRPANKKKPAATNKPHPAKGSGSTPANPSAGAPISLGEIIVPSGKLAIFDVGLMGYLPREALEPAIIKTDVPAGSLRVIGVPVGKGRFSDCWDHVSIVLDDGEPHTSKKLGSAGVDFARLMLIDHAALDHWEHEESLDGKADFVFWGRDEAALARALGAPKLEEGYGWADLTIADAETKGDRAATLKSENDWAFKADHRPHTHHYHALAAARASKHGAGTLELAGTQLMLLFTSWGDGVFPVYLELDADDHPVAVRIQLATEASNAAMRAVNR